MKKKVSTATVYRLIALAVFIFGILLSLFSSLNSYNSQREFLEQRVSGLASALPKQIVQELGAKEADLETDNYTELKSTLQEIVSVNPDIEFIYITKLRDNTVYFVADSEPVGSEDESPAGQSYDEVDDEYKSVHTIDESKVVGPTTDRWGTWISGVAPIKNESKIIAVLGMDIPAGNYVRTIVISGLVVFLPSLLIVGLFLVSASRSKIKEKDYAERLKLLNTVADNIKIPLEGVRWASNQLSSQDVVVNDPESSLLASQLSGSVERVVESVSDILGAADHSSGNARILLNDRVDIVASSIDIVDNFKLNSIGRQVAILLGGNWPASYVVDTNLSEFKRALSGIVAHSLSRSISGSQVHVDFQIHEKVWRIDVSDQNPNILSVENDNSLAVKQLIVEQLGGTFEVRRENGTKISVIFPLKGTELIR